MNSLARVDGFTVSELLVATAITLTITAALLGLIDRARGAFEAQPERGDMHQRLRVAVDALTRDLSMAGAGLQPFAVAPVMPYRTGRTDSDTDFGIFYRPDAVTVLYIPWGEPTAVSHTYHLKRDTAARIWQLMHYDGDSTDLPVVDHVAGLQFEYFEEGPSSLDPATLQDGPWVPDDPEAMKFDADLLKIRRVRVLLRVQAALDSMRGPTSVLFTNGGTSTSVERYLPDLELQFDVAVRNLNLGG